MSGGNIICPTCAEELNALSAKKSRRISFFFSILMLLAIIFLFKTGRLTGVLKSFMTLNLLANTVEEFISRLF